MKRLFTIMLALFIGSAVYAQSNEDNNASSVNFFPEAGDFALGFDAAPFINFALNVVNIMDDTGDRAQHPGYVSGFNNVIVGKYFLEDYMAVRARFGINTERHTASFYGDDPFDENAIPGTILLEKESNRMSDYFLGLGIEYRRGYHRIQGFYGAEALFGVGSEKTLYEHFIAYNTAADEENIIFPGDFRPLEISGGTSVVIGARGFVGVEYFLIPKLSIAAEFGWGIGYATTPRGKVITEHWGIHPDSDATEPSRYTIETEGDYSDSTFGFSVDDGVSKTLGGSAAISLIFYF